MTRHILISAFLAAFLGVACGDSSSTEGTFACGTGAAAAQCSYSQYCESTSTTAGSVTTTAYACRALPAGCSGDPCQNCLSSANVPGRNLCISISFSGTRQTTVGISR